MCGLVGAAGSYLVENERERFKELMILSNIRGFQGAGVVACDRQAENIRTIKTIHSGIDCAYGCEFSQKVNQQNPTSVLIGHTRWPTKGKVDLEATHPHVHDDIYGVHNGTIRRIMGEHIPAGESDSKKLFELISQVGVEDAIPEVDGAYALVWIDAKDKTLNFLRNYERPLHFATAQYGACFYWASEKGMLDFVLGRHKGNSYEFLELKTNEWVRIPLPIRPNVIQTEIERREIIGNSAARAVAAMPPFQDEEWGDRWWREQYRYDPVGEKKEKKKEEKKKVSLPVVTGVNDPPTAKRWSEAANGFVPTKETEEEVSLRLGLKPKTDTSTPSSTDTTTQQDTKAKKTSTLDTSLKEYLKEVHSEEGFGLENYIETSKGHWVPNEIVKRKMQFDGCDFCAAAVPVEKHDKVQWLGPDAFICEECSADAMTIKYIKENFGADVELRKVA